MGESGREEERRKQGRACDGAGSAIAMNRAEATQAMGRKEKRRNGDAACDEAGSAAAMTRNPAEGTESMGRKARKRREDRACDEAGSAIAMNRNPAEATESIDGRKTKRKRSATVDAGGMVEIDGAVGESTKKKTVRFQEPADNVTHEAVTCTPRESIEDEIAYFSAGRNWKKDIVMPGLRYGKFTKEEDEKLKASVLRFIKSRGWGDEGLQIVLHSSQHIPIARGCWLEIAKCLPARPVKQIHSRAYRLLGGHKQGKWSAEELEMLTNQQKLHGNNWKQIASCMDRSADICKDRWRHLRLVPTRKTGPWQQEELDELCKLVRHSMKIKASIVSKSLDRRQVRDDISWEWISEQIQRDSSVCAENWYRRLASPMIAAMKWGNGDDRLLLQRLMELGATSEEAVDWDALLDHRDGQHCEERWKQMTRLLGKGDHVSFEDKLELLAKRYAPDLVGIEEEM